MIRNFKISVLAILGEHFVHSLLESRSDETPILIGRAFWILFCRLQMVLELALLDQPRIKFIRLPTLTVGTGALKARKRAVNTRSKITTFLRW